MQVFNVYFKLMKKQSTSIAIYAILFICLTVMITLSLKEDSGQFETSKVKLMVINQDGQSSLLEGFLKYMEQYVSFVEPTEGNLSVDDQLYYGNVAYILTIPQGFRESFLKNGKVYLQKKAAPNSMEAINIDNAIDNYFNMAEIYLNYIPDIDEKEVNAFVQKNMEQKIQVAFDVERKDEVEASNIFNQKYFNYLGYIIIASFITGVSLVMFSFHGLEIRRKHSSAPITERNMNTQLILANLIFVTAYLTLLILAGFVLNQHRIINWNTILYWLNAFIFTLVVLSISYLVGISVRSKKAIAAISTSLSLSMAFLSGMFVPQEFLGKPVLKVASFTPTYWYVRANNVIVNLTITNRSEVSNIIACLVIQLGFAAAIISVALVVSKRKRQLAN